MDLRKRYEAAQRRVTDLECENAKVLEEFLWVTNEKEVKVKEVLTQNQQLKTENSKQSSKIKELDYEMQRLRSELESERSKRSGIEISSKNEILLKQAYEKLTHSFKSQKAHLDEIQMNNSELYQSIERLKVDIRESAKAIDERDAKIDSMQNDIKRALQEKADKESLIKSKRN
jgi:hypothetical protein